MVRIIIKGGVWKNTEDEVLKAAIAKYGKNQWARISSLLVRKTPKQCKARWYEWLDPSIKKTEWSKTEDEKLLHLAKLMPTQWRTIAPIVGRTATQCLERYQKLLDDAEAKENEELGLGGPGDEAGPSADDVRRLRPGEIDPDPETKPARPDPIDMDEDEKEMLSEARARLANTQGKKAKRKARERQLEEARRLAVLQKKRELKAAGIIMRHKTKKKGMDYNADIPFEKKPAAGFYDTSEEQAKSYSAPVGQSLRRLENKRKPQEEESEAKKRQKKGKEGNEPHSTKFIAARDAQIQKLKEAEQISKRRALVLPAAQVGEAELEEIVKIGQAGQSARALMNDEGEGNEASGRLLGEYEGLSHARMARTPRTAPQEDNIMAEARNLRNMVQAQTPLLGEENTPMRGPAEGGTGFESATPRHQVAFTPNPLATPRANDSGPGATPKVGATPMRTPRDNLSINAEDGTMIGDTPREERLRANAAQRSLKLGFASLPKPSNDFEVVLPEDEEEAEDEDERTMTVEDMAERNARMKKLQEEEERKALERRSSVVKRGLPRPVHVDQERLLQTLQEISRPRDALSEAYKIIDSELAELIQHDTIAHPLPGTPYPGGTPSMYDMPEDEDVAAATLAVHLELSATLGIVGATPDEVKKGVVLAAGQEDIDGESLSWARMRDTWAYDKNIKAWVDTSTLPPEERVAGIAALIMQDRDAMTKEAAKAAKIEKKLAVTLGGYNARSGVLAKRVKDAWAELEKAAIELETFTRLRTTEQAAAPRRVEALKEEVERLERQERELQARFQDLSLAKEEVQASIASKEEQIMAEAEALNEAALAAAEA
ncbi:pre-mRNA splicing factor component-domain-containing protein [Rhizoctonia solani]|nr:pre-mRNA splicing factor component-domain-containing protein [Rhizoctonia solani]